MATHTQILLVSDLSGGADAEKVRFALDGQQYEIDLTPDEADALRALLHTYMRAGRRTAGVRAGGGRVHLPAAGVAVRVWARSNGFKVSDRGRIPAAVVAAFEADEKEKVTA